MRFALRHRGAWPAVAIVVVVAAAYHFTLASLFDFLRLQTPLAYVALLPLFSLGMVVITARGYRGADPPMRDRQIDVILGVPLMVFAVLLITLAPVIASAYYWSDRADVVSMALFAMGATIVFYGTGWFWRLRAAFVFLLLAWPALYLHLMAGVMRLFTYWTNWAMAKVMSSLPLGATPGAHPGDVIISQGHGSSLVVSIGSACSGADTVLGFALIGGALLTLMQRGKVRKALWWITGLAVTFGLNIARLTSIIALAHAGNTGLALGGYHAVIGLLLFTSTLMLMAFVLPWFGLRLSRRMPAPEASDAEEPAAAPRARARRRWRASARPLALAAALACTVFMALADQGLQPYAAFDDGSGSPSVRPFAPQRSVPASWHARQVAKYLWAPQYFGVNATWIRYRIASPLDTWEVADVVLTDDRTSFDTYNLLNCYLFHSYDIRTYQRIDLGNGVYGLLLNYSEPATNTDWTTIAWAWPVTYRHTTYYERIVLSASPDIPKWANAPTTQPRAGLQNILVDLVNGLSGGRNDPAAQSEYRHIDAALQVEAQSLVERAVSQRA